MTLKNRSQLFLITFSALALIITSASSGNTEIIQQDNRNNSRSIPAHYVPVVLRKAILTNDYKIIEKLMSYNDDLSATEKDDLIFAAVHAGNLPLVPKLLEKGAPITLSTLLLTAYHKHYSLLATLAALTKEKDQDLLKQAFLQTLLGCKTHNEAAQILSRPFNGQGGILMKPEYFEQTCPNSTEYLERCLHCLETFIDEMNLFKL